MGNIIRVLVVDDHVIVRKGYFFVLKTFKDLELVADASNGEEALEQCKTLKPDVALVDVYLKNESGIAVLKVIKRDCPSIKLIALTSYEEDDGLVNKALDAGADGFIYKGVSIDELATAIRTVFEGDPYLSPNAMRNLIKSRHQPAVNIELTEREQEVLRLLSEGLTNKQIASVLHLSPNTIKHHIHNLLRKLNATTRTEAVNIAIKHNLMTDQ